MTTPLNANMESASFASSFAIGDLGAAGPVGGDALETMTVLPATGIGLGTAILTVAGFLSIVVGGAFRLVGKEPPSRSRDTADLPDLSELADPR